MEVHIIHSIFQDLRDFFLHHAFRHLCDLCQNQLYRVALKQLFLKYDVFMFLKRRRVSKMIVETGEKNECRNIVSLTSVTKSREA